MPPRKAHAPFYPPHVYITVLLDLFLPHPHGKGRFVGTSLRALCRQTTWSVWSAPGTEGHPTLVDGLGAHLVASHGTFPHAGYADAYFPARGELSHILVWIIRRAYFPERFRVHPRYCPSHYAGWWAHGTESLRADYWPFYATLGTALAGVRDQLLAAAHDLFFWPVVDPYLAALFRLVVAQFHAMPAALMLPYAQHATTLERERHGTALPAVAVLELSAVAGPDTIVARQRAGLAGTHDMLVMPMPTAIVLFVLAAVVAMFFEGARECRSPGNAWQFICDAVHNTLAPYEHVTQTFRVTVHSSHQK